jgi:hypothetical protein
MVKTKSPYKENFLYCNLLIFAGLVYVYYTMNKGVKEGISNMNCCGGVEAGIHYSETDTKPPKYIRRCFKSRDDGSYQWSSFPCSNKGSGDCCTDEGGKKVGECIPTTRGGYCRGDDGSNRVFYKRSSKSKHYIKLSNDNILDVNDVNDMKDYYYARIAEGKKKDMSPEMNRFMARRSKNEEYMERHLVDKRSSKIKADKETQDRLMEQEKNIQIVSSLTIIHLIVLVAIAITIKGAIVMKIQNVLNLMHQKYMEFSGKTI